ncbi:hypothetical protein AX16_005006 [Volvariella volvacea WC 439]|nr:hypothetical protein AX16_005006 [Volvariella volvacea WC 439]
MNFSKTLRRTMESQSLIAISGLQKGNGILSTDTKIGIWEWIQIWVEVIAFFLTSWEITDQSRRVINLLSWHIRNFPVRNPGSTSKGRILSPEEFRNERVAANILVLILSVVRLVHSKALLLFAELLLLEGPGVHRVKNQKEIDALINKRYQDALLLGLDKDRLQTIIAKAQALQIHDNIDRYPAEITQTLGFGDAILCEVRHIPSTLFKIKAFQGYDVCTVQLSREELVRIAQNMDSGQIERNLRLTERIIKQRIEKAFKFYKGAVLIQFVVAAIIIYMTFVVLGECIRWVLFAGIALTKHFAADFRKVMEGDAWRDDISRLRDNIQVLHVNVEGITQKLMNSIPPSQGNEAPSCTEPTVNHPHQVMEFALAQNGSPIPVKYITNMPTLHNIVLVDIDKLDMKMEILIDGASGGTTRNINLDTSRDCGDDISKCIEGGWSAGLLAIPPGHHEITIRYAGEELDEHGRANWGNDTTKRFVWWKQTCE